MNTNKRITEMEDMKAKLQALWVFVMFNYLYCDVITNMDSGVLKELLAGHVGSIQVNQEFMLGAALLMEIPIAMVLLSRVLQYRANRWANIIAGAIMSAVQLSSLFFGTAPTLHYLFFSTIEVGCTLFIVWYAWSWANPEGNPNHVEPGQAGASDVKPQIDVSSLFNGAHRYQSQKEEIRNEFNQ
jgi:hypothetical protein